VPTTLPWGWLELTEPPTTGLKPASVRVFFALLTLIPATYGTGTVLLTCAWPPPALPNSKKGIPTEARSMIAFQVGPAMVAPKTSPP
jgi:hypothetical protein